ncbi:hypothetical protein Tco_0839907 [Tanacetum coccineum]|uniref:Uncharacterized protein n=1 Tax=Tanacetum coccineum TaxID=301880 RepID=A0ABQ5ASM9_9ASTR
MVMKTPPHPILGLSETTRTLGGVFVVVVRGGDGLDDDDDGKMIMMMRWWQWGCGGCVAGRQRQWCLSVLKGLHYLLDKVVPAGTAPESNSSNHNVNTITNSDRMPRMRTFEKQYSQNNV